MSDIYILYDVLFISDLPIAEGRLILDRFFNITMTVQSMGLSFVTKQTGRGGKGGALASWKPALIAGYYGGKSFVMLSFV
jgi:hypothetical protein